MEEKYYYKEIAPCIFVYENTVQDCKEFVDLAFEENSWNKGHVGQMSEEKVNLSYRDVEIHDISPTFKNNKKWFELSQIIWKYGNSYGIENHAGFSGMEYPQFLWYKPSKSFYKEHADSDPQHPRIFSAVLYLNDVEEGGETYFKKFDVSVKPKAGRLVIFPANYAYIHEAKRTLSSDKFVAVTWFTP